MKTRSSCSVISQESSIFLVFLTLALSSCARLEGDVNLISDDSGSSSVVQTGTSTNVATADAVIAGLDFWDSTGAKVTGTLANQGEWNLTSGFPGAGYISGVSNAPAAGSICTGTQVVGTAGSAVCQGSSGGANASPSHVLSGTYYWNSSGFSTQGTMSDRGGWNLTSSFPGAGYISGVSNAPTAGSICTGTQVVGTDGSAVCLGAAGTGAAATAARICSNFYAWGANGAAINGSRTCDEENVPSTVAGLLLWMKADSVQSYADGSTLRSVRDHSGSQRDFGVSGNPTYLANGIGSKPALGFASNSYITVGNQSSLDFETTDPFTITFVIRFNSIGTWSYPVVRAIPSSPWRGYSIVTGSAWSNRLQFALTSSWAAGSDSVAWISGNTTLGINTNYIVTGVSTGTATAAGLSLYLNGAAETLTTVYDSLASNSIKSSANFNIGSRGDGAVALDGRVAETLVYNSALSSADRSAIECYLGSKYGITVPGC